MSIVNQRLHIPNWLAKNSADALFEYGRGDLQRPEAFIYTAELEPFTGETSNERSKFLALPESIPRNRPPEYISEFIRPAQFHLECTTVDRGYGVTIL